MRQPLVHSILALVAGVTLAAWSQAPAPVVLDRAATRWIEDTFKRMTLDDKVGQLVAPGVDSTYLPTDSDAFDAILSAVRDLRLGGIIVFGGSEPAPRVLPDYRYGTVVLGEPLAAASLLNRLQEAAAIPLLTSADFESGVPFRIAGATRFPRQMAIAAAGDEQLAFEAARITAVEGRALGLHVNFSPVADVNNNPRNPVINTRAFGEDPEQVGRLAAAFVRGYQTGGMLAVLKHFPGHGDTEVDSHIGLPIITHPRERLDAVELWPFRYAMSEGAAGVMVAHIALPALDPGEFSPASLSRPIVTGLLRGELGFRGLVFTDAIDMDAIARQMDPGAAAARAVAAGSDVVTKPASAAVAVAGIKAAVDRGEIPMATLDAAVRRLLTAKAQLGLHRTRTVDLDKVADVVGGRRHRAVANEISARSMTLIKDDRNQVPLRAPSDASILYLSILDYPSGWRITIPSSTFLPELRRRWPNVTAIELSDRSSPGEIDLVRASAARYDAIVAAVFVRTASGSGRMDLAEPLVGLLDDLARRTAGTPRPFITVFFGNPYAAMAVPSLPAMLLTYDVHELAEASAVRALAGEAPISGRLPISLPGMFDRKHGLVR